MRPRVRFHAVGASFQYQKSHDQSSPFQAVDLLHSVASLTQLLGMNAADVLNAGCKSSEVMSFAEAEAADQKYWRSRTPDERLAALELSRQIAYGYDPTARGLSRFFEVAELPPR